MEDLFKKLGEITKPEKQGGFFDLPKQEILNYNKRCADFIKLDLSGAGFPYGYFYNGIFYEIHEMKFHSDWNWIMEVVDAIEKLDNFYVQIEESACYIYDISKFTDEQCNPFILCDLKLSSKKEAVIQAINQFLIWYNNEH